MLAPQDCFFSILKNAMLDFQKITPAPPPKNNFRSTQFLAKRLMVIKSKFILKIRIFVQDFRRERICGTNLKYFRKIFPRNSEILYSNSNARSH